MANTLSNNPFAAYAVTLHARMTMSPKAKTAAFKALLASTHALAKSAAGVVVASVVVARIMLPEASVAKFPAP